MESFRPGFQGGTQDLLASNAQAGTGEAGKEKEGLGLQSENLSPHRHSLPLPELACQGGRGRVSSQGMCKQDLDGQGGSRAGWEAVDRDLDGEALQWGR